MPLCKETVYKPFQDFREVLVLWSGVSLQSVCFCSLRLLWFKLSKASLKYDAAWCQRSPWDWRDAVMQHRSLGENS